MSQSPRSPSSGLRTSLCALPQEVVIRSMFFLSTARDVVRLCSTCRFMRQMMLEIAQLDVRVRAAQSGLEVGLYRKTSKELFQAIQAYATAVAQANWVPAKTILMPAEFCHAYHGDGVLLTFEVRESRWVAVATRLASPLRGMLEEEHVWALPSMLLGVDRPRDDLVGVHVSAEYDLVVFVWFESAPSTRDCTTYVLPLSLTQGELKGSLKSAISCPGVEAIPMAREAALATNGEYLAINVVWLRDERQRLLVLALRAAPQPGLLIEGRWCFSFAFVDGEHAALVTLSEDCLQVRVLIVDIALLHSSTRHVNSSEDLDEGVEVLSLELPFDRARFEDREVLAQLTGARTNIGFKFGSRRIAHHVFDQDAEFYADGWSAVLIVLDILSEHTLFPDTPCCQLHITVSFERLDTLIAAARLVSSDSPARTLPFSEWASRGVTVASGYALPRGAIGSRSAIANDRPVWWQDRHPCHALSLEGTAPPGSLTWGHDLSLISPAGVQSRLEDHYAHFNQELRNAGLTLLTRPACVRWSPPPGNPNVVFVLCGDAILGYDMAVHRRDVLVSTPIRAIQVYELQ